MVRSGARETVACWNVWSSRSVVWCAAARYSSLLWSDQILKTWQLDSAGNEEPSLKLSVLQGNTSPFPQACSIYIQTMCLLSVSQTFSVFRDNGWLWLFKFLEGESAKVQNCIRFHITIRSECLIRKKYVAWIPTLICFVFFFPNSMLICMTPTELCSGFCVQLASLKKWCKILFTRVTWFWFRKVLQQQILNMSNSIKKEISTTQKICSHMRFLWSVTNRFMFLP